MTLSCCKRLYSLLRGITSIYEGDFCCLNCLHPYRTENNFKKHKDVCDSFQMNETAIKQLVFLF